MSTRKYIEWLADLRAMDSRTGLNSYMIPPSETRWLRGEVDQRCLSEPRLSQLSFLLCCAEAESSGRLAGTGSCQVEQN